MSVLDQPEWWASVDPRSMKDVLESFPEQVSAAIRMAQGITLSISSQIANVVITGLGGSAIGAEVVRSAVGEFLGVPLLVNRDYRLPSFVNSSTLVIASSYSGNTEETLSAYHHARRANASILCITSGGNLAAQAGADGVPVMLIPGGLQPRAALGYSSIMLLGCLRALGLIPEMKTQMQETAELLASMVGRYAACVPEESNRAKEIARSLHGKIVAIYASSAVLDSAAMRWRGQMEENGKNLAFHHLLPEMNHNELVGWECPPETLCQVGVVFLRDKEDHAQVQHRFELTKQVVAARAGVVHEVWSEGHSLLARIFSVICLGDFVSLYLAYLNAVDPTPVRVIDSMKEKLRL